MDGMIPIIPVIHYCPRCERAMMTTMKGSISKSYGYVEWRCQECNSLVARTGRSTNFEMEVENPIYISEKGVDLMTNDQIGQEVDGVYLVYCEHCDDFQLTRLVVTRTEEKTLCAKCGATLVRVKNNQLDILDEEEGEQNER